MQVRGLPAYRSERVRSGDNLRDSIQRYVPEGNKLRPWVKAMVEASLEAPTIKEQLVGLKMLRRIAIAIQAVAHVGVLSQSSLNASFPRHAVGSEEVTLRFHSRITSHHGGKNLFVRSLTLSTR